MNTPVFIHSLAELLAKSVFLLALVLIPAALMARQSAARRHTFLLAAFVSLFLLPLGKLAAPYWRWSELPIAAPQQMRIFPAIAPSGRATQNDLLPAVVPAKRSWPELSHWMAGLWLAGVVMLLGFRTFGSWRIAMLKRGLTTPADARLSRLAEAVAGELCCGARHEVRFSAAVRVPCTWGVWHAVVLIPTEAAQWSDGPLVAALRHELAHVSRRDYLTRWLSCAVCALYWPNPLVWFAARRLYAMQEQACDDRVLEAGTPATDYATLLLETARACTGAPLGWRNAIAMARPSTLENRVVAVMDETRDRRPAGWFAKWMGGLGVACVVGVSALAQVADPKLSPASDAARVASQVQISAKFIEVPKGKFSVSQLSMKLISVPNSATGDTPSSDAIESLEDAVVLAAPRIAVRLGQTGTIKTGEDFVMPLEFTPPSKQFVGTSFDVQPILADGKIDLQCEVEIVAAAGEDPGTKRPVFEHRKLAVGLKLADGGKAVLPPISSGKAGREIFTLLEASIVPSADASGATDSEGAAAPPLVPAAGGKEPTLSNTPGDPSAKPVEPAAKPRATYDAKTGDVSLKPASPAGNNTAAKAATPDAWGKYPVEINADDTRVEGRIAVATGHASQLKYGTTTITADSITYNPDRHRADFRGKVEIKSDGFTMRGENVSVELANDGRVIIGRPAEKDPAAKPSSPNSK